MAGSGRGNKGVSVVQDSTRPDCTECGGFMKSTGKRNWACTVCGKHISKKRAEDEDFINRYGYDTEKARLYSDLLEMEYKKGHKRFVITSAQNNTAPFKAFLESLKTYCKHNKSKLIIIPTHYKNVTAWDKGDEKEWDKAFTDYLVHGDIQLGKLLIKASVKINQTSVFPLGGKQAHGHDNWVVFGHAQHALETVPTPSDLMPKKVYTTGSVCQKNYSVSDQGEKAKFNHVYGALVVEFGDGKYPFIRQVNANGSGSFYDLDKRYTPKKVINNQRIDVLVPGDEHVMWNTVKGPTYTDKDSITSTLKPKYIARHDTADMYTVSHHHEKDPLLQFKKFHDGQNTAQDELDQVIDFINETTPKNCITLMVHSNHDDHLDQWLNRANPNKDPSNALFIHHMRQLQMQEAYESGKITRAFQLYASDKLTCKARWLSTNEAFIINGVDQSQHGHIGLNGARGSARSLAKSTFKMNIGHSHSSGIVHGVYQTGTSTGRMEYAKGLSGWTNTHIIQYKDGKRTLVDIINGKWRA